MLAVGGFAYTSLPVRLEIAILFQFLAIDPHFVRKGCSRISPAQVKSQFYLSF